MSESLARVQFEIEQFLYREAYLLEQGHFQQWLDLLTDDIRYWMPVRETVEGAEGDQTLKSAFALYDDDKASLILRVKRLQTGLAHAETPPSVTQRLITNVRIEATGGPNQLRVDANFLVFQSRRGLHDSIFIGRREDRLRRVNRAWKIAARKIILAQSVLPRAVSIFF